MQKRPSNQDLVRKITRPWQDPSQANPAQETEAVNTLENDLNKMKAICKTLILNFIILTMQTFAQINNEESSNIKKKFVMCLTLVKGMFTDLNDALPDLHNFEAQLTDMEEKLYPTEDRMPEERYYKKAIEPTRSLNKLRAEYRIRKETVAKENERLLKDIEAMKIEWQMLWEQKSMEVDQKKRKSDMIGLGNDLITAKEELMYIQEEIREDKAAQTEAEKTFDKTISDLQAWGKKISCNLSHIKQQLQKLEALSMDEDRSSQEVQKVKDGINECVRILENAEYLTLESELEPTCAAGEEQLNAVTEDLTRLTKPEEDEDQKIKNIRLEIEKLTLELGAVNKQKNFLNIKSLNLQNKETRMKTELEELLQKKEANINMAKEKSAEEKTTNEPEIRSTSIGSGGTNDTITTDGEPRDSLN